MSSSKSRHAVVIFSSLGLGDHLNLVGAVRYISMREDLVFIPCYGRTISRVIDMYRDDNRIIPVSLERSQMDEIISGKPCTDFFHIPCKYDIIRTGEFIYGGDGMNYPYHMYIPLRIPTNVHRDYFYLPPETDATPDIPTTPDGKTVPTALVHISVATCATDIFTLEEAEIRAEFDRDEVFTVSIGRNAYPVDHKWHALADEWGNLPLLRYTEFLKNATYIAVSDSCFFCLAALVNPPTPHCYRADRPGMAPLGHDGKPIPNVWSWSGMYSHTPEQMSRHGQGVAKAFRSIQGPPAGTDVGISWDGPDDVDVSVLVPARPVWYKPK